MKLDKHQTLLRMFMAQFKCLFKGCICSFAIPIVPACHRRSVFTSKKEKAKSRKAMDGECSSGGRVLSVRQWVPSSALMSRVWWNAPVTLAFGKWRQQDRKSRIILRHIASLSVGYLQKKRKYEKQRLYYQVSSYGL